MPHKNKKNKKKNVKCNQYNRAYFNSNACKSDNASERFTTEEMQVLKSIFGNNCCDVPPIIKATVLNKLEAVVRLIKSGDTNVNQTGPHGMAALIWATKLGHKEIAEYLLHSSADPLIETDNGETCIFTALESKLWQEDDFLELWNLIKNITAIDVNTVNKGRGLLHVAVQREWNRLIQLLISENPYKLNIDATTPEGVTPLMLASYENLCESTNLLLNANADVLKQDNKDCLALCYAISGAVLKNLKSPYRVFDRIVTEMTKRNITLKDYLQKYVTVLKRCSTVCKSKMELIHHITVFTVRKIKGGVDILLEFDILDVLLKNIYNHSDDHNQCEWWFQLLNEIVSYDESCQDYQTDTENDISNVFFYSEWKNACLNFLKKYRRDDNRKPDVLGANAFQLICVVCGRAGEAGLRYMQENYVELAEYQQKYFINSYISVLNPDAKHAVLINSKINNFQERMARLNIHNMEKNENGPKTKQKKSKRRTKALKAKIAKIKSADLAERLNISGKMLLKQKKKDVEEADATKSDAADCKDAGIVTELKKSLLSIRIAAEEKSAENIEELMYSNHEEKTSCNSDDENLRVIYQKSDSLEQKYYNSRALDSAINYLHKLLHKIIEVYQKHWKCDLEEVYSSNLSITQGNVLTVALLSATENNTLEAELKSVARLKDQFEEVVSTIKEQAQEKISKCQSAINKLENLFLTHTIRGKTIIEETTSSDCFKVRCYFANNNENAKDEVSAETFMEQRGSEAASSRGCNQKPTKTEQNNAAQTKTMNNAYHLITSIISVCEEDELNPAIFSTEKLLESDDSRIESRWHALIRSLKSMPDNEELLGGIVRVSCREKRITYVISTEGNFGPVELGLDKDDSQALAVKRIILTRRAQSTACTVCKSIKSLVNPLLELRNTHLLHYAVCGYDENELVLATPLCEYNLDEYLMILTTQKDKRRPNLSIAEIARQFLKGLRFLHERKEPVIHGNLKPSNVFIDLNGTVRIADFGMHKALFRLSRPSDSSIIWFSRETYQTFRKHSVFECTCASDIQVAGMLAHFILNNRKHAYGDETKEILRNLEKSTPKLLTNDVDQQDLITWMLLYEPNDRPTIAQVLAHVFFWPAGKKWRFILTCSGIERTPNANSALNIQELHASIKKSAKKDDIKGSWVSVLKPVLPNMTCMRHDDDTPTGLLRFIKHCLDNETAVKEAELRDCIVSAFPALPLSLYRMLESTSWLHHPSFRAFVEI